MILLRNILFALFLLAQNHTCYAIGSGIDDPLFFEELPGPGYKIRRLADERGIKILARSSIGQTKTVFFFAQRDSQDGLLEGHFFRIAPEGIKWHLSGLSFLVNWDADLHLSSTPLEEGRIEVKEDKTLGFRRFWTKGSAKVSNLFKPKEDVFQINNWQQLTLDVQGGTTLSLGDELSSPACIFNLATAHLRHSTRQKARIHHLNLHLTHPEEELCILTLLPDATINIEKFNLPRGKIINQGSLSVNQIENFTTGTIINEGSFSINQAENFAANQFLNRGRFSAKNCRLRFMNIHNFQDGCIFFDDVLCQAEGEFLNQGIFRGKNINARFSSVRNNNIFQASGVLMVNILNNNLGVVTNNEEYLEVSIMESLADHGMIVGEEVHSVIEHNQAEDPGTDELYVLPYDPRFRMGIEVETSTLKTLLSDSVREGFKISHRGTPLWEIVDDTLDKTSGDSSFGRNVEFRTIGGLGPFSVWEALNGIQYLMREFFNQSNGEERRFLSFGLEELLRKVLGDETAKIRDMSDGHGGMDIQSRKGPKQVLRPQITYQIPFDSIIKLFDHMNRFKDCLIRLFIDDLTNLPKVVNTGPSSRWLRHNRGKQETISDFFRSQIHPRYKEIDDRKPHKSFSLLFLYYWYQLFNDKTIQEGDRTEPGLKKHLGIMSRIPFSQLYESLPVVNRLKFRSLFGELMEEYGEKFTLRDYTDYDCKAVANKITLKNWYASIVDPFKRNGNGADLLSPLPGLEEGDSMGKMDIQDSSGYPLLEVRAYANIQMEGSELTIDNIGDFIKKEAIWFFGLIKEGERQ